ncbi:DUF6037 family protein [Metabacillus niabensis]|uniref:DUF6037 family protein n=1 Tax=Metabacillus niabensis TaxID=324854 RepID=UPI0039A0C939
MTQKKKTEILFKTLPFLLKDMEQKGWIIDSFPFQYKGVKYIILLTRYKENERKPNIYAKAKVEFVKWENTNITIKAYIDFYEVKFEATAEEFCKFFGVEKGNSYRDLFKDFAQIFSRFIPKEKVVDKSEKESKLIGSRVEGNNPNAIFLYDVRRSGVKKDGLPKKRTIENSNKAFSLRKEMYERYGGDDTLSFYFSDKEEEGKSDDEIIRAFSERLKK